MKLKNMANRLTDTLKWNKGFMRGLPGAYKLLWLYLCDECNHAGIWDVDKDIAQIKIGNDMVIDWEKALILLQTKIIVIDNGQKWFIPSFVKFHYKELKGTDNATKSVITQLKKYNLITDDLQICLRADEGLTRGCSAPLYTTILYNSNLENNIGVASENKTPVIHLNETLKSIDVLMTDALSDKINFVEHVMRENKMTEFQISSALSSFVGFLKSGGELVKTSKDFRFHFQNWLKKQDKTLFRINPMFNGKPLTNIPNAKDVVEKYK